LQSSFLHTKQV